MNDVQRAWTILKDMKNVIGHSSRLQHKIIDNRTVGRWAIRVYVTEKEIDPQEIVYLKETGNFIPRIIENVETDVLDMSDIFSDPEFVSAGELYVDKKPMFRAQLVPMVMIFTAMLILIIYDGFMYMLVGVLLTFFGLFAAFNTARARHIYKALSRWCRRVAR